MSNKILITYATKYGSTGEVADKIGEVLTKAGFAVEVLPVDQVATLSKYGAVVFGSAVYAGQWRKEAVKFLEDNRATFAEMPFWIFSSGPTGSGDPVQLTKGWLFPDAQKAVVESIQPRAVAVFHGWLDFDKLNLGEKLIVRGVRAPMGDYRDWDAIVAWAREIAAALQAESSPASPTK